MTKRYAETAFFESLINSYGGIEALSKKVNKTYGTVNNWKTRGYVSKKDMEEISKTLGISMLILNNKHFHYICNWKKELLDNHIPGIKGTRGYILSLPLKYK